MHLKLPEILKQSADDRWERFCSACKADSLELPDDDTFQALLRHAFALSDFVSDSCILNPSVPINLGSTGDLFNPYPENHFNHQVTTSMKHVQDEVSSGAVLRAIRLREMVRIAVRDLCGISELSETMNDLSALACACVDGAFSYLYDNLCISHGIPYSESGVRQRICVLGMGKLGADELNFSSDIDLIFAYPESGNTGGIDKPVSCDEFFTLLAHRFLKIFGPRGGPENLFRVDMRLRPFGENGPIIMSFDAFENYYVRQGREWERYALIKASAVAGDIEAGSVLLERLSPFVYRRYFDYGAYDSLRDMKRKIETEVTRKGLEKNIKTGEGGIREIEFFGQVFQLIRGGVEPCLRERRLLKVLAVLVSEGYIEPAVCDELTEAYLFLRNCEHRLQAFSDKQTHDIPEDPTARLKLAVSMGFESYTRFEAVLFSHRSNVRRHFNDILSEPDLKSDTRMTQLSELWEGDVPTPEDATLLKQSGFSNPDEVFRLLSYLRNDFNTRALSTNGRKRLNRLMPLLLKKTGASANPEICLTRLVDLVKTIERRTCYISLITEQQEVLEHLVTLSGDSPWIISYLAAHPVLLDDLVDIRRLYSPPDKSELRNEISHRVETSPDNDLEMMIEQLTIFKHSSTLRIAAADISGLYPLMKISDYLTYIAEVLLEKIVLLSWDYLIEKHGPPARQPDSAPSGFAVIGYGKLGGIELGYGSDLDLVFLCTDTHGTTTGKSPVPDLQFYSRLGQRIIHLLTTYTRTGKMYTVDMRLRPGGISGSVVSTTRAFRDYLARDAWTWEHQALVRSRAIYGDPDTVRVFHSIRNEVLTMNRDRNALKSDIRTMRETVRQEHDTTAPGFFSLKHGRGGIIDIEFIVQYLILSNAAHCSAVTEWTDNIRQIEALSTHGFMDNKSASFLSEAFLTLRKEIHRLKLQEKPPVVPEAEWDDIRNGVTEQWNHYFGDDT